MNRETGWYWIKIYKGWVVAKWYSPFGFFQISGDSHPWKEKDIYEIDETPIKRKDNE